MSMSKEDLVKKLVEQGIDQAMAESLAASAMKGATKETKKPRKRFTGEPRAKKYVGRFEFTEICQTCGSTTTRRLIIEIDPSKPRSTEVPVHVCNACIPNYRKMSQDELISLIILKDHPVLEFRLMSNKNQIRLAKAKGPVEILNSRLEVPPAPDNRHLKPEYDEAEADMELVKECQLVYNKAVVDLGPELGGHSMLDLFADNTNGSLAEIRLVIPYIKKHAPKR